MAFKKKPPPPVFFSVEIFILMAVDVALPNPGTIAHVDPTADEERRLSATVWVFPGRINWDYLE